MKPYKEIPEKRSQNVGSTPTAIYAHVEIEIGADPSRMRTLRFVQPPKYIVNAELIG